MFDVVRTPYKSPPKRMAGCSGVGKVADNCDYKIHTRTLQPIHLYHLSSLYILSILLLWCIIYSRCITRKKLGFGTV
jgi:hypothetical protein